MSDWIVKDAERGSTRPVDSRAEAEEVADELRSLGADVEIIPPNTGENQTASADGGPDVVETQPDDTPTEPVEPDTDGLDAVAEKDIATDPLSVMPQHFVDQIQGVPTINRKGYAVLAEHFNVSVKAEPVTLPSETDFEYAEFKAVATTEDGQEYSGFGSAHVDRQDGDDPHLLAELAETRAMKRATAWATGVGITAYSEMSNSL
jgi:hypothetical protein